MNLLYAKKRPFLATKIPLKRCQENIGGFSEEHWSVEKSTEE